MSLEVVWGHIYELPWTPIWLVLKEFLLPAAGICVAWKFSALQASIAKQQADTAALALTLNSDKMRLELFEKRFAVFEAAEKLINQAHRNPEKISMSAVFDYFDSTKRADWLFDAKTANFLTEKVFQDAHDLATTVTELVEQSDPTAHKLLVAKKFDISKRFIPHSGMLYVLMKPYLGFTNQPISQPQGKS